MAEKLKGTAVIATNTCKITGSTFKKPSKNHGELYLQVISLCTLWFKLLYFFVVYVFLPQRTHRKGITENDRANPFQFLDSF
jgi:hypothetical protein